MNNVENQYIICLCTNYCYCINICSNLVLRCSVPIPILVKNTISVANIVVDPIIGTPLVSSLLKYSLLYMIAISIIAAISLPPPLNFFHLIHFGHTLFSQLSYFGYTKISLLFESSLWLASRLPLTCFFNFSSVPQESSKTAICMNLCI